MGHLTQRWRRFLVHTPSTSDADTDLVRRGPSPFPSQAALQPAAHLFPPAAALVSFSSLFIFFNCTPCFSFREPLPRPAIWSPLKQSVGCAEATVGVGNLLELKRLTGRESLSPHCGEERGFQKKSKAGHNTSLVHSD